MGNILQELKRRNVVKVVGAYLVVGWVLMQIATALEESLNLPEWFDGVVVALLIVGLPVAIIISWVFDLTADGVVRTEDAPGGNTNRKLNYLIGAALVIAGAIFAWQSFDSGTPETLVAAEAPVVVDEISTASIAVLPFADLSPAGDQEYFSDGISEEILNLLAGVEALDVTSRTSAFQFKGRDLGIPEIAARLKVRHVVEGSVRKAGDTLRITAQLIDAKDDRHLWSDTFDRPLTAENIFAIQDEISLAIVDALGSALGIRTTPQVSSKRSTDNLDAYELFLQARRLYQSRTELDRAEELLAETVDKDPNFAEAWAIRAANQFLMADYQFITIPSSEITRLTNQYSDKALAIDPENSTAIAARANVMVNHYDPLAGPPDYAQALADFTRAIELDPRNDSALNWRGRIRLLVGDVDGALRDFETCIEVEPLTTPCGENYVTVLAGVGKDIEAFQHFQSMLDSGLVKARETDLSLLARLGEETAFKMASNDITLLFGWNEHDALYNALRSPGEDHSQLLRSLQQFLEANPERKILSIDLLLSKLGVFSDDNLDPVAFWHGGGNHYRQTQTFKNAIRDRGILSYWQKHGFPPQCHAIGADDFECD